MNDSYTLKQNKDERGVVSLITVIFFMVFISLIVMSFVAIVVADQRQTIDNDLSASALAAARSGIEDGKRILLYCRANPSATGCARALSSQDDCDAFSQGVPGSAYNLVSTLGISIDTNGEGATGNASEYQQYFTCLTVQNNTDSLSAPVSPGSDFIQRLDTVTPFDNLKVSWSGTGTYVNRSSAVGGWPALSAWNNGVSPYIPVIRLQIIPYPKGAASLDLNGIEANSRTVFIVPCNGSLSCIPTSGSIYGIDPRAALTPATSGGTSGLRTIATLPPIVYASPGECSVSPSDYGCSVTLSGFDGAGNTRYYVRVSSIYSSSNVTLAPLSGSTAVNYDGVQPWIDVTGRTNDVFKRVRAQVSYQPTIPLPTDALESAAPICKKLSITNDGATTSNNCN